MYLVDGVWGNFGTWTECSADCGGGDRIRTRYCDNPPPQHGGNDCTGSATESETCNELPCASKSNMTL